MWDIARQVTDEVIGPGAYAAANEGNPDPRVREQVAISRANAERAKTAEAAGRQREDFA
jgi:hypothetical protein